MGGVIPSPDEIAGSRNATLFTITCQQDMDGAVYYVLTKGIINIHNIHQLHSKDENWELLNFRKLQYILLHKIYIFKT